MPGATVVSSEIHEAKSTIMMQQQRVDWRVVNTCLCHGTTQLLNCRIGPFPKQTKKSDNPDLQRFQGREMLKHFLRQDLELVVTQAAKNSCRGNATGGASEGDKLATDHLLFYSWPTKGISRYHPVYQMYTRHSIKCAGIRNMLSWAWTRSSPESDGAVHTGICRRQGGQLFAAPHDFATTLQRGYSAG